MFKPCLRVVWWIVPFLALNVISLVILFFTGSIRSDVALGYALGSLTAQSTIAAAWAAFGPGRLGRRIPLSFLWVLLLPTVIAFADRSEEGKSAVDWWIVIGGIMIAHWGVIQVLLWAFVLGIGIQLRHRGDIASKVVADRPRFGVRHLLVVVLVVSIIAGSMRAFITDVNLFTMIRRDVVICETASIMINVTGLFAVLKPGRVGVGILIALLVVSIVTFFELQLLEYGNETPTNAFVSYNIATVALVLACSFIMRLNGYCLCTPMSTLV